MSQTYVVVVGYINGGEATDTVYAQTRTPLGTHRHTDN